MDVHEHSVHVQGASPDLIIEGGLILTLVPGEEPIPQGKIAISGGQITAVGPSSHPAPSPGPATDTLDATQCLVLPGLINAHTHGAMTLFRGAADDMPLQKWLFEKIFPMEAAFVHPETVYWGTLLACMEMMASGTTAFVDGYFFEDEAMAAAQQAGLRGLLAQGLIDFPAPGVPHPKENLTVARDFVDRWKGVSPILTPSVFCHSPLTCSENTLVSASRLCQERGVPLQIHLSETRQEVLDIRKKYGMSPVQYLDHLGVLGKGLVAVHCVHVTGEEIEILKDRDVRVVHVPESNMKLGSGLAPLVAFLKAGLTVGLGTDGCCSNNNLDLFGEMDMTAKVAKGFSGDPTCLKAREVLHLATGGGAAILGMEPSPGTIEPGKAADLIILDLSVPHLTPLYDPVSALVYAANGGDVRDVIVHGKILLKDRQFTTIDSEETMARVQEIARKVKRGPQM